MGQSPTERFRDALEGVETPRKGFSFESWINHHVNQPIGFAAVAGGDQAPQKAGWAFAYHSLKNGQPRFVAHLGQEAGEPVVLDYDGQEGGGFQEYWWHAVVTCDGRNAKLYVNGELVAEEVIPTGGLHWAIDRPLLEMAAYLENEPEMRLSNLIHHARLYDFAIEASLIEANYKEFQDHLTQGLIHPGAFHFTAGPYLNAATQRSMRVLWETDRPATATLEWGPSAKLGESVVLDTEGRIQEYEITGLEDHTPYFYRVTAKTDDGDSISSGTLTFQTAVGPDDAFRFAVLGDTETRPHINHALSKRIWGERPNFVVVLGDLTDGGKEHAKWQWTHEYFAGVAGLCSRVPFFPVPGNGEGDLYWYKRYHSLPGDESPYAFRYGNTEFFMLDSNLAATEFAPGARQHAWLEQRLKQSDAVWRVVCFHHAPFCSDEDDYGNSWNQEAVYGDPNVRQLVPLFEQYGVDLVMFGHIHSYERSRPIQSATTDGAGVVYLLCGGGGGNLEDFAPNPVAFSSKVDRGHHYCLVNVDHETFELRMYDLNGVMKDLFTLSSRARPRSNK